MTNKKVNTTDNDLRLLSCFGNGDDLRVCEALRPSEVKSGKFFCNECGCGDKPRAWLNSLEETEYSKLDYPVLECPREMPGFTNYNKESNLDERKTQLQEIIQLRIIDDIS